MTPVSDHDACLGSDVAVLEEPLTMAEGIS